MPYYWVVAFFPGEPFQVHVKSKGTEGGITQWEAMGKELDR